MDKRFFTILIVVVLALGGMYYFTSNKKDSTGTTNGNSEGTPTAHTTGAGTKKVTLIEYGDYECPACGAYHPILKQIIAKYGDQITFQFRNFPLDSIHQNARAAARAAEAAAKQNKFWEMHDKLYETQQAWKNSTSPNKLFEGYAAELKLDPQQFKTDYQSDAVNSSINADIAEGQKIKAVSTPTFVLNGKKIDSETQQSMGTVDGFSKVLDAAIAKANPGAAAPSPAPTPESAEPAPVITPSTGTPEQ